MLHKCANAQCATLFRKMDEGRLFQLAQRIFARGEGARHAARHHAEYFWLCGPCSLHLTLVFDPRSGVAAVPVMARGKMPVVIRPKPLENDGPSHGGLRWNA